MPFIGQDWRSPGEAWVKTETLGWQRMKIIESQLSSTCNQSAACSWPPRDDYGQHMYNHCSRRSELDTTNITAKHQTIDQLAARTSSLSSSDAPSTTSSSVSSRGSSLSPSPSSSPEKNTHHIHPIAISSPYGWHSCSAYHPARATNCCTNEDHQNQSIMSRSLSKESLVSTCNNLQSRDVSMRYNRSVSDFRNSPNCPDTDITKSDNNEAQRAKIISNGCIYSSPPILMKDGRKIDNDNHSLPTDIERTRSSSETTTSSCPLSELDNKQNEPASCRSCCCCSNTNTGNGLSSRSPCNFYRLREPNGSKTAPHCRISVRTREVAMYNTISEAFYRLDFCNAIHDIRRFNYICKLLHLLITQNLTSLSGCATRVLFSMLEQVAWEVSNNKRNIHILKNLLKELRQMIERYYCWGRPIGSSLLWQQHFETMERISQIVNGIELAPPKGNIQQASFNDLPVEMIREILLRLNDYRDLVNSAQASPVMQIMIDNQYIWQKLCKYHFTDQQLKFALENRNNYQLVPSTKQKTNSAQGIKYARTASADGRGSYRNPVNLNESATSKSKKKDSQSSVSSGSRQRRTLSSPMDETDSSSSSSYVTRTIRIFDRKGSSATLGTSLIRRNRSDSFEQAPNVNSDASSSSSSNSNQRRQLRANIGPNATKQDGSQPQSQTTNNLRSSSSSLLSSRNIDWERVFHQLRKKFDLKEEYPDCLLLCRHCRCLFWKSFGHPCIKTEDIRADHCSHYNGPSQRSAANQANLMAQLGSDAGPAHRGGRPSVADLSRNFSGEVSRAANAENIRPPEGAIRGNNGNDVGRPMSANLDAARLLRARQSMLNPRQNGLREDNVSSSHRGQSSSSSSAKRDELIPKHVAISPQAFLKFFSL